MFDIRTRISYIIGAIIGVCALAFCGWIFGALASVVLDSQKPHTAAVAYAAHVCALAGAIIAVWGSIVGRPGRRRTRAKG